METIKKISISLVVIVFHIIAVATIIYTFLPVAKWYYQNPVLPADESHIRSQPLWGVDFFYTVTLTEFLKQNFSLPPGVWTYMWFTGWPFLSNFPVLHYYLILPLLSFFSIISAVKIYVLVSLGLFFVGLYAAFYKLSRNFAVSAALAIAAIYSVGVYGTLMWGGSLPNHATQALFPWVVFFLISYLKPKKANAPNIKYLLAASLTGGFAIWGHPQIVIAYIFPTAAILFLTVVGEINFVTRVKALFLFLVSSLIIGLPLLYPSFGPAAKSLIVTDTFKVASSTARVESQTEKDIKEFHRKQPERIYVDTNTYVFVILGISAFLFLITFIIRRKLKSILSVIPFFAICLFFVFYIYLFSFGISIYHGGWYRLFWATPFWIGLLAAGLWGNFQEEVQSLLHRYNLIAVSFLTIFIALLSFALLPGFSVDLMTKVIPRSNPSSAFPDIISLQKEENFRDLRKILVPKWINGDSTDYRMYSADQTVNIWWNSLFKMPLARGYFDPPDARTRGYTFWLDAALSEDEKGGQQLATSFHYPEDIAFNNTLFLINWYGIKYLESGHAGPSSLSKVPPQLTEDNYIKNREVLDFNSQKFSTGNKTLNFFELKDDFVTPILFPTDAPTLGIVASDQGYETVVRGLADANIGISKVIPVRIGRNLDSLSLEDLTNFNAVFLYDYQYKNRDAAFKRIATFVKRGGNVFIDSGVETPESDEGNALPEVFPTQRLKRGPVGTSWQFESAASDLGKDINFAQFSPPIFDQYEWKISHPLETSDVRKKVGIILKNKGAALLAEQDLGEGHVIWSGMNLPYHVSRYHNSEEIKFYSQIVTKLIGNKTFAPIPFKASFINAQNRLIESRKADGIIFKEQNYPGWSASLKSGNVSKNVKIWSAGPSYPGFMYVRTPEDLKGANLSVHFKYGGSIGLWALFVVSVGFALFIIEQLIVGGRLFGRATFNLLNFGRGKIGAWWSKEGE